MHQSLTHDERVVQSIERRHGSRCDAVISVNSANVNVVNSTCTQLFVKVVFEKRAVVSFRNVFKLLI